MPITRITVVGWSPTDPPDLGTILEAPDCLVETVNGSLERITVRLRESPPEVVLIPLVEGRLTWTSVDLRRLRLAADNAALLIAGNAEDLEGMDKTETLLPHERFPLPCRPDERDFRLSAAAALTREARRRKKAEDTLQVVLEGSREAVFLLDENQRIASVNRTAEDMTGYSAERIVGMEMEVLLPAEDRTALAAAMHPSKGVFQKPGVVSLLRRYGEPIRAELSAGRLRAEYSPLTVIFVRDLTEYLRALDQLRTSEASCRELIERLPEIIFEIDLQGRLTYANRRAFEAFGVTRSILDTGLNVFSLLVPEDRERAVRAFRRVLEGFDVGRNEYRLVKPDGTSFPGLFHSAPITRDGRAVGVSGFIIDVSEQRKAHQALKQSEAVLNSLFSAAPVGIGLVSDGVFVKANERLCRMLGYYPEELLGKPTRMLYASEEEFLQGSCDGCDTVAPWGTKTVETRWRCKNGAIIDVLLGSTPLDLAGISGSLTISALDITARKQMENALKEGEALYRTVVESSHDGILIVDDRCLFTFVNEELCRILGYESEELIGKDFRDFLSEDTYDLVVERYLKRQAGEPVPRSYQFGVVRRDGEKRTLQTSTSLLKDGTGRALTVSQLLDVTESRRMEEEKARLQAQLQHAQKLEAIGTLASGVAHDFNNILQAIGGYTQLMRSPTTEQTQNESHLAQIERNIDRAAELVRRLLTFSRKVEPELKPFELNTVVEQALSILERTLPKMIRVERNLGDSMEPILGDSGQVEQAILNLGANAGDAMPQGGTLHVETSMTELDEADCGRYLGAVPGPCARLVIRDTGQGINSDTLKHIFDPFFTTKEVGKGTGLGLSMVYGIMKSHGGHVSCDSRPGNGTTFTLLFPVSPIKAPDARKTDIPKTEALKGDESVLIVDDETDILEIAGTMLERFGYRVHTAVSGEIALELYKDKKTGIHLVVLDLGMPGMGGYRTLLRLIESDPKAKVLIASGYVAGPQVEACLQAGAAGFVAKPYKLTDMLKKVREVLDSAQ